MRITKQKLSQEKNFKKRRDQIEKQKMKSGTAKMNMKQNWKRM